MPVPVYDQEATVPGTPEHENRLRVKVYPLQRISGALLLTVDITPVSDGGSIGLNLFGGTDELLLRGAFRGASLIDTRGLVRYGALRQGSAKDDVYSSAIESVIQKLGVTYRLGGFFPDPGRGVDRLSVDLQTAGMVPDVPISSEVRTAPGLVRDLPGAEQIPVRDDLVTWPTAMPEAGAYVDRHELVAKVVGGTVNEGSRGVVSVNSDVLFAFDSATVTPAGTALVRQTAGILAAKADPTKPVQVVGYTDSKGTPAYNQQLSDRRANAVTSALIGTGLLGGLPLMPRGRGEKDPVAANTRAGGGDNPEGRALNRRVEIIYSPKSEAAPSPTVAASPSDSASASGGQGPATTQSSATESSIRMPRASVPIGPGGTPVFFDPAVQPLRRDGRMTLVHFEVSLEGSVSHDPLSALSSHEYYRRDLGDVRLVDPVTRRAYVPAHDRDDPTRVLCTSTVRMVPGSPYGFACYVAELAAGTTSTTVSLGVLGTATDVPVVP